MATPPRAPDYLSENEDPPTVIRIPESGEIETDVAEEIEICETKLEDLCKEYQELQLYDIRISEIDEKTEDELHAKPPEKEKIASTSRESRIKEESVARKSGAGLKDKLFAESNILQCHRSEDDESATTQKIKTSKPSRQQHILQEKYNPEAKVVVEDLEALSKSKRLTGPNLSQHHQSDNVSTCKETKTHRQQEGLHQETEQSDTISKSTTLINPNLNQSHQDENIKSKTSEETKNSATLHHQEVQEDLTGGKLTANIQESSGRRKILSGSSSDQNRQGKTIKQPAIGESETGTPLQQIPVKKQSVADQIKESVLEHPGTVPKNTGAMPKNTGAMSKNTGAVPKNTGAVPKNRGAVPKSTGAIPKTTGAVSKNTGAVPKNTGAVLKNRGAVPKSTGAIPKHTGAVAKSRSLTQAPNESNRNKGERSKQFTCRKASTIPSMQRHRKYTSSSETEEDRNRPSTSAAFSTANTDTASNFSTPSRKSHSAHKSPHKLSLRANIKTLATISETITHDYATEDSVTYQRFSSSFMRSSENLESAQNLIVPGSHSRASEPDMFRGFERASSVEHSAEASFSSFRTHVLTEEDRNETENEQRLSGVGMYFIPDPTDEELSQAEEDIDATMDVVEHGEVPSGLVDRLLESGFEVELSQSVEESESSAAPEGRRMRIQVTQVSKDAVFSDFNQLRISERYGDDDDSDS